MRRQNIALQIYIALAALTILFTLPPITINLKTETARVRPPRPHSCHCQYKNNLNFNKPHMAQEYKRNVVITSQVPANSQNVYFDDHENIFNWTKISGTNASSAVAASTARAYQGAKSAQITTGPTTPLTNNNIVVQQYAALPNERYVTFSLKHATVTLADDYSIFFDTIFFDGVNQHRFGWKITKSTGRLDLETGNGTFTQVSGAVVKWSETSWNHFSWTVDLSTGKYVRLVVGGKIYAIGAFSYYKPADITDPEFYMRITCTTLAAMEHKFLIDNFVEEFSNAI